MGKDKRPLPGVKWGGWKKRRQTRNELEALRWEKAQGIAAVGGPVSGHLVCIDIDDQEHRRTVDVILADVGLPHDYPWVVRTPGEGWHVWLICQDWSAHRLDRKGRYGGRVEVRAAEHMTMLPPSLHTTGKEYAFEAGWPSTELAHVNAEKLLEAYLLVTESEPEPPAAATERSRVLAELTDAYVRAALSNEVSAVRRAPEGQRNNQLNKSAFALG